jgi:hypothetical protein
VGVAVIGCAGDDDGGDEGGEEEEGEAAHVWCRACAARGFILTDGGGGGKFRGGVAEMTPDPILIFLTPFSFQ